MNEKLGHRNDCRDALTFAKAALSKTTTLSGECLPFGAWEVERTCRRRSFVDIVLSGAYSGDTYPMDMIWGQDSWRTSWRMPVCMPVTGNRRRTGNCFFSDWVARYW